MTLRAFALCAALVVLTRANALGQIGIFPVSEPVANNSQWTPWPGSLSLTTVSGTGNATVDSTTVPAPPPHLQMIPAWCAPSANGQTYMNPFHEGVSSCQMLAGFQSTIPGFGPRVSDFTYVPISMRSGLMLTTPQDDDICRGNWELLCDVTGAPTTSGMGHWLAGTRMLFRYNFVQPDALLVPYVQAGTGFLFTDVYQDRQQRGIGQFFEFYSCVGAGVHCFLTENWSLDIEAAYQHISNARMASRNYGMNPVGGQIGFTYFFPAGH